MSEAVLYDVGLSDEDMVNSQVKVSSVWYEGNTCNMHLLRLSEAVKEGDAAVGMVPFCFSTVDNNLETSLSIALKSL